MVRTAVFAIGSELLEGSIVDTNSAWLGSRLTKAGFDVEDVRLIPDRFEKMVDIIRKGFDQYDVILTTGGLGPTFDDLTAEAVAKAAGTELEMSIAARDHMMKWLERRGVTIKESHTRQSMLPKGCMLFKNGAGTAFGFGVEQNGCVIISMPGVPYEMTKMFERYVLPYLLQRFELKERHIMDVRIGGLPESDIDDVVRELRIPASLECIINVTKGECLVKLRGFDRDLVEEYAYAVKDRFPKNFIGFGDDGLAAVLLRTLREKGLTIAVAESCTGGMLGKELTEISGSSDVFMGGVIAYSNEIKARLLRVPEGVLAQHGAVSEDVAKAMAVGAANQIRTRCAIAVTGIAGPTGGTAEKPVGTVCLAYCLDNVVTVKRYEFPGDRDAVRSRAVKTAMREMTDILKRM